MKVSGSANAKAIEEYLRSDKLRLIFLAALPIIKLSQYNAKIRAEPTVDAARDNLY